jgi:hypothetical protein
VKGANYLWRDGRDGADLPYGTSASYDPGGRLVESVRAKGHVSSAFNTDPGSDVFPTHAGYPWQDGQAIIRVQGPNERLSGGPQSGAWNEQRLSATGQLLLIARGVGYAFSHEEE